MKTILTSAVLLCIASLASAEMPGAMVFVAPNGNDANPGTLAKPFASLQRAQQQARKAAGREAVTVMIREGTYYLPEPLVITSQDAGGKAAPVVYQAYQNERPVLSGGVLMRNLKWAPYKDGIVQAMLPEGFTTDQLSYV